MVKLRKILIIIIVAILSIYLLMVFILFNFPYNSLISRIDNSLQSHYGATLSVDTVTYRYPLKLYLENLRIVHESNFFFATAQNLYLRYRIFSFSKLKSLEMSGNGIDVKSDYFSMSDASLNLISKVRLFHLIRGAEGNHVGSVRFIMGGADIERVLISGFELDSMRLKQIQFFMNGDEEGFTIERGIVSADVLKSDISGIIGYENLDILITITLTDDFFRKFSNLRSIVNSVFEEGTLRVKIEGSIRNPRFRIVRG